MAERPSNPPQDLPNQQVESVMSSPEAELIDRLKNDLVFASDSLDRRGPDELRAVKEAYADQLMLSNEINEILLDPDVSRFRPERVSECMMYHCANLLWDEPLSDEIRERLEKMAEMLPEKYAAYQRDIARLLKGKLEDWPEGLPQAPEADFEDPFRIGHNYLSALANYPFSKSEFKLSTALARQDMTQLSTLALTDESEPDPSKMLGRYVDMEKKGQLPLSYKMASLISKIRSPRGEDLDNPVSLWSGYMSRFADFGLGTRIPLFMRMRGEMPSKSQAGITSKILREYFDTCDQESIQPLIALHQSPAGEHFTPSIQRYPSLFQRLVFKSFQGSPLESAFALRVIQRYSQESGQPVIPIVFRSLYSGAGNIDDVPRASALRRLLATFLDGKAEDYSTALRQILDEHQVVRHIPITLIRKGDLEDIRHYLREKYAVFGVFPDEILDTALNERLKTPGDATEDFYLELKEAELPASFDHEIAAIEIMDRTSLPLAEVRRINLNGILGSAFKVTLIPAIGPDYLGSWTLRIQYTGFCGHRLVNETVQLNFEDCALISDVPAHFKEQTERIGIYCAHQFFVRQKVEAKPEHSLPKPPPDRPSENSQLPDTKPEIEVEEKDPERDSQKRQENPMTIDITTQSKKRMKTSRQQVRNTLKANKDLIERLLRGEYLEEELEKDAKNALLHRVDPESPASRPVYKRVPADEVLDAVLHDELTEKDWYCLDTLPHMKRLPYHVWERSIEFVTDEDAEEAKMTGQPPKVSEVPLWLAERERRSTYAAKAYRHYTEAGFPDLSDFNEVEAWLGIKGDAVYEKNHVVELKTEDGEDLALGKTTKTDTNAKLTLKVNNGAWMAKWLRSQRRILEEEIDYVRSQNLPAEEKNAQIGALKARLEELPQHVMEIMRQTSLHINRKTGECRSTRLTFSKVFTDTTFNQGKFLSIGELVTKPHRPKEPIS